MKKQAKNQSEKDLQRISKSFVYRSSFLVTNYTLYKQRPVFPATAIVLLVGCQAQ
jgi:hypothetical protein